MNTAIERPLTATKSPMTFGQLVREAREAQGLSQAELACRIGITQGHIRQMENSGREPNTRTIRKYAEALNIPPQALLPQEDYNYAVTPELLQPQTSSRSQSATNSKYKFPMVSLWGIPVGIIIGVLTIMAMEFKQPLSVEPTEEFKSIYSHYPEEGKFERATSSDCFNELVESDKKSILGALQNYKAIVLRAREETSSNVPAWKHDKTFFCESWPNFVEFK